MNSFLIYKVYKEIGLKQKVMQINIYMHVNTCCIIENLTCYFPFYLYSTALHQAFSQQIPSVWSPTYP